MIMLAQTKSLIFLDELYLFVNQKRKK